jgi:hypothetical protein
VVGDQGLERKVRDAGKKNASSERLIEIEAWRAMSERRWIKGKSSQD